MVFVMITVEPVPKGLEEKSFSIDNVLPVSKLVRDLFLKNEKIAVKRAEARMKPITSLVDPPGSQQPAAC